MKRATKIAHAMALSFQIGATKDKEKRIKLIRKRVSVCNDLLNKGPSCT